MKTVGLTTGLATKPRNPYGYGLLREVDLRAALDHRERTVDQALGVIPLRVVRKETRTDG